MSGVTSDEGNQVGVKDSHNEDPCHNCSDSQGSDSDFISAKPSKNAGIAAKTAVQCADIFFPHD